MTVGAPTPLERECVQGKDHHASAEIVVGHIHFIGNFIEPNFLDASHNHRRRRRIFRTKRRGSCGRLRSGVGIGLAAPTGGSQKSCDRTSAAAPWNTRTDGSSSAAPPASAALPL